MKTSIVDHLVRADHSAVEPTNDAVERAARAMFERQKAALPDQEGVNAQRPWRAKDVPPPFWDGYVLDARAALSAAALATASPSADAAGGWETFDEIGGAILVENGRYWTWDGQYVEIRKYVFRDDWGRYGWVDEEGYECVITHVMPVDVPAPPSDAQIGEAGR